MAYKGRPAFFGAFLSIARRMLLRLSSTKTTEGAQTAAKLRRYAAFLMGMSLFAVGCVRAQAQESGWARYNTRVTETQSEQPHWVSPLVTTTPRLDQKFRADFVRQRGAGGYDTWNLGNSKGPEVILGRRVDVSFNLPPFLDHAGPGATGPKQRDGFGDVGFQLKYRVLARNETHGSGIVTAVLGASVPTGKYSNGSCCAVLTPAVVAGKGWGRFDVVSAVGGSLPVSNVQGLGRQVTWNTSAQWRLADKGWAKYVWPEVESNDAFYRGGANDGKVQSFVTPGLMVGRIRLRRAEESGSRKIGMTLGAGEQIAVSHYHGYNHAVVLSGRVQF